MNVVLHIIISPMVQGGNKPFKGGFLLSLCPKDGMHPSQVSENGINQYITVERL